MTNFCNTMVRSVRAAITESIICSCDEFKKELDFSGYNGTADIEYSSKVPVYNVRAKGAFINDIISCMGPS